MESIRDTLVWGFFRGDQNHLFTQVQKRWNRFVNKSPDIVYRPAVNYSQIDVQVIDPKDVDFPIMTVLWNKHRFHRTSSRTLVIHSGQIVKFVTGDRLDHTLTRADKNWNPGEGGNKFENRTIFLLFRNPGTYYYVSNACPNKMCLRVIVKEKIDQDVIDGLTSADTQALTHKRYTRDKENEESNKDKENNKYKENQEDKCSDVLDGLTDATSEVKRKVRFDLSLNRVSEPNDVIDGIIDAV